MGGMCTVLLLALGVCYGRPLGSWFTGVLGALAVGLGVAPVGRVLLVFLVAWGWLQKIMYVGGPDLEPCVKSENSANS